MQPGVGISNGSRNGDLSTFRFPCDDESTLSLSALDDVEGLETALPLSTDDFPFVASTTNAAALDNHVPQGAWAAALGTISAGVAHEVNNPLTYVLLNVEHVLLRLRAASTNAEPAQDLGGATREGLSVLVEALEHAIDGADRIRRVVRDLLTFAQGNVERRALVDVRALVESSAHLAGHEILHRARFSKTLSEVPLVEAYETSLAQVILGLVLNAMHAIPEGGSECNEVTLATRTDASGNAVVEISDTGSGLVPEALLRESCAGLALAIPRDAITGPAGEITVASVPGQGTTFRVVLRPAKGWPTKASASR